MDNYDVMHFNVNGNAHGNVTSRLHYSNVIFTVVIFSYFGACQNKSLTLTPLGRNEVQKIIILFLTTYGF